MDFFSIKMKGEMILSDTDDFPNPIMIPNFKEYDPFEIKNGSVQPKEDIGLSEIRFDVDEYEGYVKGFIYAKDGKFLGNFHYRIEHGNTVEKLQGTYIIENDVIYISGIWYDDKKDYYFLMHLKSPDNKYTDIPQLESSENTTSVKADKVKPNPYQDIFTKERLIKLTKQAEKEKNIYTKKAFDSYTFLLEQDFKINGEYDFVKALNLAYIMEFDPPYLNSKIHSEISALKAGLQIILSIKSRGELDKNIKLIQKTLLRYYKLSGSLMISSFSLHLLEPTIVPFYWKEIGKLWNTTFEKDFKTNSDLKLKIRLPDTPISHVTNYLHYWGLLLDWKESSEIKNIKPITDAMYWV